MRTLYSSKKFCAISETTVHQERRHHLIEDITSGTPQQPAAILKSRVKRFRSWGVIVQSTKRPLLHKVTRRRATTLWSTARGRNTDNLSLWMLEATHTAHPTVQYLKLTLLPGKIVVTTVDRIHQILNVGTLFSQHWRSVMMYPSSCTAHGKSVWCEFTLIPAVRPDVCLQSM